MPLGLAGFDRRALGNATCLVGIDEVGRGCLAGPVVAAAIRCEARFYASSWCRRHSRRVDDSKRLTAVRRAEVVERFTYACKEKWIQVGIASASVAEIGTFNIYHATTLAMRRALASVMEADTDGLWSQGAAAQSVPILIDGRPIRNFPYAHQGVVKGDQRSLAIALAGIHAKEWRDARMRELDTRYPQYGFGAHKGYGTEQHLEALRRHGPTPEHREVFLRKVMAAGDRAADVSQGSLFRDDSVQSEP